MQNHEIQKGHIFGKEFLKSAYLLALMSINFGNTFNVNFKSSHILKHTALLLKIQKLKLDQDGYLPTEAPFRFIYTKWF